ncbi:phage tail tape measure protein [Streptomyces siamensis]|uniref:Phage tail tape measure protein domain-containing protein n=1 Tax=Streptomyces siamensis TaxID=1274986 RepID=A0ABP9IKH0_9ACTN
MSDTSLVFNLVARDQATETLGKVREKFDQAATGIAAGVAGGLGVGIAASLDMSAANAKLAAQLGVGPAEAAKLSKVSSDVYANAWGESTEDVNNAIRGVYQNIGDTSKAKGGLEGVTTKALALAETFDQEVGPTTAAVGQMLKTGLAKNADEAFDILTRGMQTGANKADDLLDTVNEYGTQWRKFGLDGKTAMGLLSQGLKGGARDADLVADSIKEFSIRAIDGSKTTADGFKAIGLNAKDMATKIGKGGKGATEALDETLDRLRNIKDPVKRSAAAVQLFGTQAEDLGDALYSLDPSTAVDALGQVGGAADKMSKTVGDSPSAALEGFKRKAVTKLAEISGTFIAFAMDNQAVFEPLAYIFGGMALAILAIKGGMMAWAAAQAVWSAATAIATGVQWAWNTALLSSPLTWIILAVLALVAVIVIIATKTDWFQTLWSTVWDAIKTGTKAAVDWISGVLNWFSDLPGKFASWWGSAKDYAVGKMTALVNWVKGLPGRASAALSGLAGALRARASSAFQSMRDAASSKASALMTWASGIPGRISKAVSGMGSALRDKGRAVIQGLWNGIAGMGGWLWSKVKNFVKSNVVNAAKSFLHIGSPSKLMADQIGHWVPAGVAMGIEKNAGVVDKAMTGLVDPSVVQTSTPLTTGMAPLMGAQAGGGTVVVRFETAGAEDDFHRFLRKLTRVKGRGNVQTAFGQ